MARVYTRTERERHCRTSQTDSCRKFARVRLSLPLPLDLSLRADLLGFAIDFTLQLDVPALKDLAFFLRTLREALPPSTRFEGLG